MLSLLSGDCMILKRLCPSTLIRSVALRYSLWGYVKYNAYNNNNLCNLHESKNISQLNANIPPTLLQVVSSNMFSYTQISTLFVIHSMSFYTMIYVITNFHAAISIILKVINIYFQGF